jgi:hypothetical protein
MAAGEIVVTIAGANAVTLSADEAAELAEALWEIGSVNQTRGAIAISGALKAAAHRSSLVHNVDLREGDQAAVQEALDDVNRERHHAGFNDLRDAMLPPPSNE